MDAEHTDESSALRPTRRTDKLIVRAVGDELVTYDLATEQVTALGPQTARVFTASNGESSLTAIATGTGLSEATAAAELDRLSRAGLIAAGWVTRRTLIGAAIATPLLTIAAAEAAFATSITGVAWSTSPTAPACSRTSPGMYNFSATAKLTTSVNGQSYPWQLYEMSSTGATTGGTLRASGLATATNSSYSFTVTQGSFNASVHYLRLRVYSAGTAAVPTGPFQETATPNLTMTPSGSNCSVS